jgi:uncharacterized protein YlxW (UPF0749 family)
MREKRGGARPRRMLAQEVSPRSRRLRRAQGAAAESPGASGATAQVTPPPAGVPDAEPVTLSESGGTAQAETAVPKSAAVPVQQSRRRLRRSLARPGKGQIIAAAILFVVGVGATMQVRINNADDAYSTARREDLVQLLDGLTSESRRIEREIADLERTRTSLESGADTQRVARQEAEERVEVLSILAGTVPAEGPGIRMRIVAPPGSLGADVILDAVEEMRDAGAEVMEVNDEVRVVASTWFANGPDGLLVDGQSVGLPVTMEVIGDPHSLEEAARFRGGLVSEITGGTIGGQVQIEQLDRVVVESLHSPEPHQYAQPASPPPTPR